jgi:hypothetical protein
MGDEILIMRFDVTPDGTIQYLLEAFEEDQWWTFAGNTCEEAEMSYWLSQRACPWSPYWWWA